VNELVVGTCELKLRRGIFFAKLEDKEREREGVVAIP
jgi:hypothetical protein